MIKLDFIRPVSVRQKVRLGPAKDGGYIVHERTMKEADILVSYGVGWDVSFEEDFWAHTGKGALLFDPTLVGKNLVSQRVALKLVSQLRFKALVKYLLFVRGIWKKRKDLRKKNLIFVNEGLSVAPSGKYDTIARHLNRFGINGKRVLLKIDIEGGEYEIFEQEDIYRSLGDVTQLILEFHDLKNKLHRFKRIVDRLRREFEIVHVHGNNWGGTFCLYDNLDDPEPMPFSDVIELTFVRKDEIRTTDFVMERVSYPIEGLDYPNNPAVEDHKLVFA